MVPSEGYPLPDQLSGAPGGYTSYNFAIPSDAGERVQLCRILWESAGETDTTERLLWITGWSVWPSGEHMPLFKLTRRAHEGGTLYEPAGTHRVDRRAALAPFQISRSS